MMKKQCCLSESLSVHKTYFDAYDPVSSELKRMMVSSRSQIKTRSTWFSGSGLWLLRRLDPRPRFDVLRTEKKRIKINFHSLVPPLASIINQTIKEGSFPEESKKALVTQVNKKVINAPTCRIQISPVLLRTYQNPKTWLNHLENRVEYLTTRPTFNRWKHVYREKSSFFWE